ALMGHEWSRLCNDGAAAVGAAIIAGAAVPVAIAALAGADFALVAAAAVAGVVFAVAWATGARRLWSAAGVVYVSIPCIALVWLRADQGLGRETIFWLFAVVWTTDTGAYFAGRGLGGPKLAPRISPQKTWAGLAGGVVCAALTGAATAALLGLPNPAPVVLLSAALAFVAQAGDLGESMVKRRFGAKDSGQLIPGHGGVLDRLDGLMTAAPAVAAGMLLGGEGVLAWR
ncbi:MAG: phosphatidate cytidylyltransferase, partial [Alphaproteobacteria bacterium]